MPSEISDWISLAALATSFIAYLKAKKANKTGVAIEALKEVISASEKTQTYLQARAEGKERDRATEYELAEKWSYASFLISRVDKGLSIRLDAKSKFWRNPETWDSDLRAHKNIDLDSVAADARRLMSTYA